jgi:hypothetical protein
MAAPLYVSYTPQTTGDHVICYHQVSPVDDGVNFCCITDTTPSAVGVPKVFTIPDVLLDCAGNGGTGTGGTPWDGGTTTNFSGYVYPVCNSDLKVTWGPVQFAVA